MTTMVRLKMNASVWHQQIKVDIAMGSAENVSWDLNVNCKFWVSGEFPGKAQT